MLVLCDSDEDCIFESEGIKDSCCRQGVSIHATVQHLRDSRYGHLAPIDGQHRWQARKKGV